MANRNAKLIERVLKDFSLNIGSGGGAQVVTELPKVGEEHTVYELRETSKGAYDWVTYNGYNWKFPPFAEMFETKLFVFDTYEQMVDVLTNITPEISPRNLIVYTRLDDMLYHCGYRKNKWSFSAYNRMAEYEHYVFTIPMGELIGSQYILKSFDGFDEEEGCGLGTLPDGTKVKLYSDTGAFVLRQATFDVIVSEIGTSIGTLPSVNELPTVEEGSLTSGGLLNGSSVVNFNGKIKYSLDETDNYYYDYDDGNFRVTGVWEDKGPLYTGELEWTEEMPDNVKEAFFEEYPYESVINQTIENDVFLFQPKKSGEVVSSYWIYTNGEWVNVDDISYTSNQIFVSTTKDYTNRPDRTITIVELDTSTEEPSVISEVPYKIIDEEHIIFYNVPSDKTLYLCIDRDLIDVPNTDVNSYDFNISFYHYINNKGYYNFNIETIGGSIKVSGVSE